jgi:DNA repair exonuclease SbcCD nuclease subunit
MARVAFIFRTDVHLMDKSPASWKGDYPAEIWSDLEQIGELARVHEVTAVLDGGDYFHLKPSTKNPHHLNERTATTHNKYPCRTYGVEGNHDMSHNNLDSIVKQPLGVLFASGVFNQLREEVFRDGTLCVRVVGVPYNPNLTLADLRGIQKKEGDTHLIAVVHALATKKQTASAEDFFNEPVFDYPSLTSRKGPDCWLFGHWHKDQGIEVIDGKTFVNLGSVSRGSLVRENLERTPKVALIEISGEEGLKVTPIELNVLPASEVFDLEKKATQEKERKDIESFIATLSSDLLGSVCTKDNVVKVIQGLSFADEVRNEALRYLEMVD